MPDTLTDPETIAFLPEIEWLRPSTVAERLGDVGAAGTEPAAPGLHGNGLGSVTVTPAGTALVEGATVQIPATEDVSFDIEIANQGEHPEESVVVAVEIAGVGRADPARGDPRHDQLPARRKIVNVPLAETPPIGEPVEHHDPGRAGSGRGEDGQQRGHLHRDLLALVSARGGRAHLDDGNRGARGGARRGDRAPARDRARGPAPASSRSADRRAGLPRQPGPRHLRAERRRRFHRPARMGRGRARPGGRAAGGGVGPHRRVDRLPLADPLRRLRRDVGPPVELGRAARRPQVGRRDLVDPAPRPGARVREAADRRSAHARALARGAGGGRHRARSAAFRPPPKRARRLPRAGRHLHRGGPARVGPGRASSRFRIRPSTTR